MAGYSSGELFWDTAEARAPRWVLLLDGPPGVARRRLDPQERATPQGAVSDHGGTTMARLSESPRPPGGAAMAAS
jgi:hypothetical protein